MDVCLLRPAVLLALCPALLPRCILQLSLLGYILVPIFAADKWWLTGLYTLFMLAVAAIEAVSRPSSTYSRMLLQVGGGMPAAAGRGCCCRWGGACQQRLVGDAGAGVGGMPAPVPPVRRMASRQQFSSSVWLF